MTKNMHAKPEDFAKAMNGTFSPDQANKTKIAPQHFDYINLCLENLNTVIGLLAKKYEPQISLLSTIPGVNAHLAIRIFAEIGNDMSVFPDPKHLCSWAGLTAQNNESAGKKKSVHISHAGQHLKPVLIQNALAAVKSKDCPYFALTCRCSYCKNDSNQRLSHDLKQSAFKLWTLCRLLPQGVLKDK